MKTAEAYIVSAVFLFLKVFFNI